MDSKSTRSRRAVIIDDDRGVRALVTRALRADGLEVEAFEEAAPALERICDAPPAFILVDLVMPGDSGVALAKQVRDRLRDFAPPIALVSASLEDLAPEERGLFDFVLPKPFRISALRSLVRELLLQARSQRMRSAPMVAPSVREDDLAPPGHDEKKSAG